MSTTQSVHELILACRAMRKSQRMDMMKFSTKFGIPYQTYRAWECGARHPGGTSQILLKLILACPGIVAACVEHDHEIERVLLNRNGS
jgi:DNA-binding transcriptional regulator YiaG